MQSLQIYLLFFSALLGLNYLEGVNQGGDTLPPLFLKRPIAPKPMLHASPHTFSNSQHMESLSGLLA